MKLLILDRDGTLNRSRDDYVASPDEWEPIPGALEAVAKLNHGGWRVVLATNQSGIGRGLFEMTALNEIHAKLHRALAAVGGRVEAIFFCPHAPEDGCDCRKPNTGLFDQIGRRFGLNMADVPAAGNALRHVQAATAAGCPAHLLLTGQSEHLRDRLGGDRATSCWPWCQICRKVFKCTKICQLLPTGCSHRTCLTLLAMRQRRRLLAHEAPFLSLSPALFAPDFLK